MAMPSTTKAPRRIMPSTAKAPRTVTASRTAKPPPTVTRALSRTKAELTASWKDLSVL
jgi:hypothetical protein